MAEIIELTPASTIQELTPPTQPGVDQAGLVPGLAPGGRPERPEQQLTQRKPAFFEFLDDLSRNVSGFTAEAINTATFGLGDVVAGSGFALAEELFGGQDADPGRAFNRAREERLQFREENPISSGVSSFVGGFINPASGPAGAFVQRGAGLLGQTGRSAVTGAGFGSAQVAGEEAGRVIGQVATGQEVDPLESAERIGTGGGIGTGIGLALPPAIKGLGFLGKQGIDFLRRFSQQGQQSRAFRKVAEALERDGFTPQQALERIEKLGPEAALLDAGENSRALAFTVAARPGEGKTRLTDFVRGRQEGVRGPEGQIVGGQVNRIQDHMDQLVKANFFTEAQRLANINNAAKLYQNAYRSNQVIDDPTINRLLKTPSGRKAFQEARKTLQDLRRNLSKTDPELAAQLRETGGKVTGKGVGKGLKLEFLDQVKQELWDLEQIAKAKTLGKASGKSRAISELRRDLTKAMDAADNTSPGIDPNTGTRLPGDYAKARLAAGDKLGNIEALELGSEFLSKTKFSTPEELGVALQDMTPEARHLFRVGAAQSLKGRLADIVSRADATKKLIDIQSLERKVALAFGDNKKFQQYVGLIESEKEMFRAVTEVLGNSKTAARGAALDDLAQDPGELGQGVANVLLGRFTQAIKNFAAVTKGKLTQTDLEAKQIAEILAGRDVAGFRGRARAPTPEVSPVTEQGQPRDLLGRVTRALAGAAGSQDAGTEIKRESIEFLQQQ